MKHGAVMRLGHQATRLASLVGVLLGLWVCAEPLAAQAAAFKPPKRGIPARREGGGTRAPGELPWTVLLPYTSHGYTQSSTPRVFWLMPREAVKTVEFELLEVSDTELRKLQTQGPVDRSFMVQPLLSQRNQAKSVYKTSYQPLPAMPTQPMANPPTPMKQAIASLTIPRTVVLSPNRTYFWAVKLEMQRMGRVQQAGGWLEVLPVNPDLTKKLAQAQGVERLNLLEDAGLWYDSMAEIADQTCKNPSQKELWAKQLQELLTQTWYNRVPRSDEAAQLERISKQAFICQ